MLPRRLWASGRLVPLVESDDFTVSTTRDAQLRFHVLEVRNLVKAFEVIWLFGFCFVRLLLLGNRLRLQVLQQKEIRERAKRVVSMFDVVSDTNLDLLTYERRVGWICVGNQVQKQINVLLGAASLGGWIRVDEERHCVNGEAPYIAKSLRRQASGEILLNCGLIRKRF